MSAECEKCGSDLTYGNWPVGECQRCELEAERDELLVAHANEKRYAASLRQSLRAHEKVGLDVARWIEREADATVRADQAVAERDALRAAAQDVVDTQQRLVRAVTPGHPEFLYVRGPNATPEDAEKYDALFSRWHSTTRALGEVLGDRGSDPA